MLQCMLHLLRIVNKDSLKLTGIKRSRIVDVDSSQAGLARLDQTDHLLEVLVRMGECNGVGRALQRLH